MESVISQGQDLIDEQSLGVHRGCGVRVPPGPTVPHLNSMQSIYPDIPKRRALIGSGAAGPPVWTYGSANILQLGLGRITNHSRMSVTSDRSRVVHSPDPEEWVSWRAARLQSMMVMTDNGRIERPVMSSAERPIALSAMECSYCRQSCKFILRRFSGFWPEALRIPFWPRLALLPLLEVRVYK
ncbi:hypothetical protein J6590_015420 [Homalodisca vitripennis]|nr:hypothetical protein J6590_015420 [Homalodisca vitripennis]